MPGKKPVSPELKKARREVGKAIAKHAERKLAQARRRALQKVVKIPSYDLTRRLLKKYGIRVIEGSKSKAWKYPPLRRELEKAVDARLLKGTKLSAEKVASMFKDEHFANKLKTMSQPEKKKLKEELEKIAKNAGVLAEERKKLSQCELYLPSKEKLIVTIAGDALAHLSMKVGGYAQILLMELF